MEKVENLFNSWKGIIVFYIVVAILAFMLAKNVSDVNTSSVNNNELEVYYA